MERAILHVDLNCCYAQIECQHDPALRDKPVVVAGKEDMRHGIVMAKNQVAKMRGIKTACTLREARDIVPDVVVLPPDFEKYKRASQMTRQIYYSYSDQVEPFGIDESWIDVTNTHEALSMTPEEIAYDVNRRIKDELGLTTSVGLSWNKIFAKFGSDYKKPDAVTIINRDNYKEIVWESPVRDLLYVGAATERKLRAAGIFKIGQLASASDIYLKNNLGKMGFILRDFALGLDCSPVKTFDEGACDVNREIKSYGNGITFPRDITDDGTAKAVIHMLAESVSSRMRDDGARANVVSVTLRSALDLGFMNRQQKLKIATNITIEIADIAWNLARENHIFDEQNPIRGISVTAGDIDDISVYQQQLLIDKYPNRKKLEALDKRVDEMRRRYGNNTIMWGARTMDDDTASLDIKGENTVHPVSFFHD
jgi:DNA polymerase IV